MEFLNLHQFVRDTAHDKALGAIIGSALGDIIGLYTEFLPKSECHRAYPTGSFSLGPPTSLASTNITPFRADNHRDKFDGPGQWTDDTDQALLLMLSYLHNHSRENESKVGNVIDPIDVAKRLRIWIEQGLRCLDRLPLGIGQTIGRVVLDPEYTKDPVAVSLKIWLKSNRNAAPNGSLMRTHPLGVMCVERSLEETFQIAADVGRITHVDPRCVVSCCLVTALVRAILRGELANEGDLDAMIEKAYKWVEGNEELRWPERKSNREQEEPSDEEPRLVWEEYRKHCYAETFNDLELDERQKIGYVYKCLGSAVLTLRSVLKRSAWSTAIHSGEVFESLITELVMEGGDADTNACVAGALLGAWVGYSRLPERWERGIRDRQWLVQKAEFLSWKAGILASLPAIVDYTPDSDPDSALDGGKGMLTKDQLDKRERDLVYKILEKQKSRREADEREERAKKGSVIGKWFK